MSIRLAPGERAVQRLEPRNAEQAAVWAERHDGVIGPDGLLDIAQRARLGAEHAAELVAEGTPVQSRRGRALRLGQAEAQFHPGSVFRSRFIRHRAHPSSFAAVPHEQRAKSSPQCRPARVAG